MARNARTGPRTLRKTGEECGTPSGYSGGVRQVLCGASGETSTRSKKGCSTRLAGSAANPQSLNRYSYSTSDPANVTDPSGLCPGGFAQSQPSDDSQQSSGHGPNANDSDAAASPQWWNQGPCPGFTDQGGGGGFFLDGGDITDTSGGMETGFAPGAGSGGGGGLVFAFFGSANFHWNDYTLDELLNYAADGEISVTLLDYGSPEEGGGTEGGGGNSGPGKGMDSAKLTLLKADCISFIESTVFSIALNSESKEPGGLDEALMYAYGGGPVLGAPQPGAAQMMVQTLSETTYTTSSQNPQSDGYQTNADTMAGSRSVTLYAGYYAETPHAQGQTLIHEAIHDAFGLSDQALALDLTGKSYPQTQLGQQQASDAWNNVLKRHCR